MESFGEKYRAAYDAWRRYLDAPRKGWLDPKGRKTRDNQTIEVGRAEAVRMAESLTGALYCNYSRLYENYNLKDYMDQIAEGEPDAVECTVCFSHYRLGWMDGKCPYCAAAVAAAEKVREMLEEN